MRSILQKLMFDVPEESGSQGRHSLSDSSPLSSPTQPGGSAVSNPAERYYALEPADRLAILRFMCDIAMSSKQLHAHLDGCEEQLTALRKERIEINRQKKQL